MSKGTIQDLFYLMILLFLIGITVLVGTYLKNEVMADIKGMLTGTSGASYMTHVEYGFKTLDYVFLFMAIGFGVVTVVLAFQVQTHPVFFFISLVIFAIIMLIVPAFSNMFHDFASASEFSGFASDYSMMLKIFENFPKFFMIFGFLISIVTFAKMRGGGEE